MKTFLRIAGVILGVCVLMLGSCVAYVRWRGSLPSDRKADRFFAAHERALTEIVAAVRKTPQVTFVSADWVGFGDTAKDPSHLAIARLLKASGAKFARQWEGAVEVYFWGDGCAICYDSFEGFVFVPRDSRFFKDAAVVQSLEDRALPRGKYAPIDDGIYLRPLHGDWYIVRWECG